MAARAVTGIVLAGGRSVRFGSRDKLAVELRGRPLLHHSVEVLAGLCDEVLVIVGADAPEPQVPRGARILHDPVPDEGPLVGLAAGLAEVSTPLALVVAGDMPDLVPEVLLAMLRIASDGAAAVALEVAGDVVPLPCVLPVGANEVASGLIAEGKSSLRALLGALQVRAVPEPVWRALDSSGATLRDIDEPEQLR